VKSGKGSLCVGFRGIGILPMIHGLKAHATLRQLFHAFSETTWFCIWRMTIMNTIRPLIVVVLLLVSANAMHAAPASLTVDVDRPGVKISPTLWGIFFEDINLSADGGIYPEFVRNRSFEDSGRPDYWTITKGPNDKSEIAIDSSRPLDPMNRQSLRVKVDGSLTLTNKGYWGMNVIKGESYQVRLAARAAGFQGPIAVSLQKADGSVLARGEITGFTDRWKGFSLDLKAADTDPKAQLSLTISGKGTLWMDMVCVASAKTWKSHGLRPDLCEMLVGLKPAFVRFPGGCWVEGDDMAHMYHWKETIGEIWHRKPLWNIWRYWATHGLGYHEYLQMCEDLGAEPLFVINCGMSHREVIPTDQMGQWVQDALDAIEYANGPTDSLWGGLRAKNGHPEPFHLQYIEIGNENGGPPYQERYALFYDAIRARYPQMTIIADQPTHQRPCDIVDEHYYSNPEFFMQQADRYDKYDRKGPKIYVGEYAVTQDCGQGNLRGAIGEAAFMTGMERNADIVVMASYAPLFANVNYKRWNPDLICFDSSRVYGLPSYYVQKMFAENRGDVVLPVAVTSPAMEATSSDEGRGGAIGVGTWLTQAEFKDIKVTKGDKTLFSCDFADGTKGWKLLRGAWKAQDGVLRQTSSADNVRAIAGDKSWTDYTYTLKARKLGGAEGFLVLFNVRDENRKSWWNLGGWGNQRHAIEMGGIIGREVPGSIETGRWYDIRIETSGQTIKCYLDGKLIHDVTPPVLKSLYASASRVRDTGEVILKVVNTSKSELSTDIKLSGVRSVQGPTQAIVLTSENPTDENSLTEPTKVAPVTKTIDVSGPSFSHAFPGNSVTILRLTAK
jgi:alpha-L-arabinofuranosidase